jgi:hypothetical protein
VDLVRVDPSTGGETLLYRFGAEAAGATVVIDGEGTLYVGPMSDGTIDVLIYAGGSYSPDTVPTTLEAGEGLTVDADGALYTFAKGAYWHEIRWKSGDRTIYKVDPESGSTSTYGYVDGNVFIWDWAWSGGRLWVGCRGPTPKGKKERKKFIAEAPAGGTAGVETAITQSAQDPYSVAAAPGGKLLLLETPITLADNALYEVTPGSGGGDGDDKPPKKPKK